MHKARTAARTSEFSREYCPILTLKYRQMSILKNGKFNSRPIFLEISWGMDLMVRYVGLNVRALQNFRTSGKLHRRLVLAILGDKFDSHRRIENFSYAADTLED